MKRLALALTLAASTSACGGAEWETKVGLLNAVSDSVSKALTGSGYTDYQRRRKGMTPGTPEDPLMVAVLAKKPLCQGGFDGWLNQECKALEIVDSLPYCKDDARCIAVRLAPFIEQDPRLFTATTIALVQPCSVVANPAELKARHQLSQLFTPGQFQDAGVTWDNLKCEGPYRVTAKIAGHQDGTRVIRF